MSISPSLAVNICFMNCGSPGGGDGPKECHTVKSVRKRKKNRILMHICEI